MIIEANQSTRLPSFVPDPRYGEARHRGQAIWPEAPLQAGQLAEAQSRAMGNDLSVMPFLEATTENTTLYFNDVAKGLDDNVRKNGLVSQRFDVGDASFFDNAPKGSPRAPLDLAALGLPAFEQRYKEDNFQPLAIIVHSAQKTGDVGKLELIVTDGDRVESRYLENIMATQDPQTQAKPRWIYPGSSIMSRTMVEPSAQKTVGRGGKTSLTISSNDPFYGKVEGGGSARIIRQAPTRAEKTVASPYHEKEPGKLWRRLGAMAAGLALITGASSLFSTDPGKNTEIKTAHELVLPAGTYMDNGIKQAEKFFSEDELSRSRKAFEAYFAGDTESLRAQAKALGYESNWMKAEAIAAVDRAESYDQLIAAFDKAFDGLPVKLKVFNNANIEGMASGYYHQPASDFDQAKQLALSVVRLFNVMDKEYLDKMEPLDYIITGKIKDIAEIEDPGGYYVDGEKQSYIVLADAGGFLFFSNAEELVGHETGHYQDLSKSEHGDSNPTVFNLHPGQYVGPYPDVYRDAPTSVEGQHAVARAYGNVNQKEDTATVQEAINKVRPTLRWENSPLGEKQMAIIFEMEKKYPGFTASLLERTTTDSQSDVIALLQATSFEAKNYTKPSWAAFILTLSALAGHWARRKVSSVTVRNYGYQPNPKSGR
ncbi:MAG TPA: hypothetical protein VFB59_03920 [Candidatus Saccharimonadales bacterium]|nr:hypothetical protein [Candidatus Saccharimonadales bacterium]